MPDNEPNMVILFWSHELRVIYITEVWVDINMSKSKVANSDSKDQGVQLTKINYNSYVMNICLEISWQPF